MLEICPHIAGEGMATWVSYHSNLMNELQV